MRFQARCTRTAFSTASDDVTCPLAARVCPGNCVHHQNSALYEQTAFDSSKNGTRVVKLVVALVSNKKSNYMSPKTKVLVVFCVFGPTSDTSENSISAANRSVVPLTVCFFLSTRLEQARDASSPGYRVCLPTPSGRGVISGRSRCIFMDFR